MIYSQIKAKGMEFTITSFTYQSPSKKIQNLSPTTSKPMKFRGAISKEDFIRLEMGLYYSKPTTVNIFILSMCGLIVAMYNIKSEENLTTTFYVHHSSLYFMSIMLLAVYKD